MKTKLFLLVAGLQALVLAFIAGQREWIARTGTPVVLRTAPIDPMDPMRGAYVRLDYEINSVPFELCRGRVAEFARVNDYRAARRYRDLPVYAELRVNADGIAEVVALSDEPPASGLFLRGRLESSHWSGQRGPVRVRYGVEALFLQQDEARRIEAMARAERAGAPLNATVAVGASGIGVLRDYAWEPLGLTLELERAADASRQVPPPVQRRLQHAVLTWHNYGDTDLAIVPSALRLVRNERTGTSTHRWIREDQPSHDGSQEIIVLQPGETYQRRVDLQSPAWHVVPVHQPGAQPLSLSDITEPWGANFRFRYEPPSAENLRGQPNAELVRHAPLSSRGFNAAFAID